MKTIVNLTSLIVISSLIFAIAQKSWIRLSYEINKLDIIERFCVNKEVETFSCEGKCHLMSQLEAAESPDEQNQKEVVEEQRIVLFSLAAIALPVATSQEVQNKHWNYLDFYQFNYTFSIFHPPRLRTYLN